MYAFHGSLLHKSPGNHSLYDFSSNMGPIWVLITSKDASSQRDHSALLSEFWKAIRSFGPIRVKFTKITREWPKFRPQNSHSFSFFSSAPPFAHKLHAAFEFERKRSFEATLRSYAGTATSGTKITLFGCIWKPMRSVW